MIPFTKTESLILNALLLGPKTTSELEEYIDRGMEYSDSYIRVFIYRIKKRGITIHRTNHHGESLYSLDMNICYIDRKHCDRCRATNVVSGVSE